MLENLPSGSCYYFLKDKFPVEFPQRERERAKHRWSYPSRLQKLKEQPQYERKKGVE